MIMSAFKFERASSASSDPDSGSGDDNVLGEPMLSVQIPSPTKKSPIISPKYPMSPTKATGKKKARTASTAGGNQKSGRVYHAGMRTLYTAGRPPWYNSHGELKDAFVIGLCGGSASGKTTVARRIIEQLDLPWVSLLSMDSFYKVLGEKEHELANQNEYNFDHPDAFDFKLLVNTLQRLKRGKKVEVPIYNFVSHSRDKKTVLCKHLTCALQKKRPRATMDIMLLHQDNTPTHMAEATRMEMGLFGCQLMDHSPYSPDFAPMDFSNFPIVKSALKGQRFDSFQELWYAVHRVVSDLDSVWFRDMFDQWITRYQKCISVQGDYIEK